MPWSSPTFWVAVAFFAFIALIWKPVGRFILKGLDGRSDRIRQEVENGINLREEAQAALSQYQRKQHEAIAEAEEIIARAKNEAQQITSEALKNVEALLETRSQLALEKIKTAEGKALEDVQQHAVAIIHAAVRETLREQVDDKLANDLVESAMGDIQHKLH